MSRSQSCLAIFGPTFQVSRERRICVLTRSGQDPVVVNLEIEGVAEPEHVPWVDPLHRA